MILMAVISAGFSVVVAAVFIGTTRVSITIYRRKKNYRNEYKILHSPPLSSTIKI
jgi:hypothetical protein